MTALHPDVASIQRILAELSEPELDQLTVLALDGRDASCSSWAEVAARYGLRRSPSRALAGKDLEPLRDRLREVGILSTSYSESRFQLSGVVALEVLSLCHARGRLAELAEIHGRARDRFASLGPDAQLTRLRVAVLLGDARSAHDAIARAYVRERRAMAEFVTDALGLSPRPEWLALLPDHARTATLSLLIDIAGTFLMPIDPALFELALATDDKALHLATGRALALRGDPRPVAALGSLPRWGAEGIALLHAFWGGHLGDAVALGDAAIAKMTARKHKRLPGLEGACHMLALAATSSSEPRHATTLGTLLATALATSTEIVDGEVAILLDDVHAVLTGAPRPFAEHPPSPPTSAFMPCMVWLLHAVWISDEDDFKSTKKKTKKTQPATTRSPRRLLRPRRRDDVQPLELARALLARATASGVEPVARELAAIVTALEGGPRTGLAGAFDPPAPWQTALAALEAAAETSVRTAAGEVPVRQLVWEVSASSEHAIELTPRILQSTRAKKGRSVSILRLLDGIEDVPLDAADRAVLAGIEPSPRGRSSVPVIGPRAVLGLIGHPRVISPSGEPLVIERGTPAIVAHHRNGHTHVEVQPPSLLHHELVFEQTDPRHAVVYERPAPLEPLCSLLAHGRGLAVPDAGRDRLVRALTQLGAAAAVKMEGDLPLAVEDRPADPRPHVQLRWDGATLDVRLRVAPLGPTGPSLQPGHGSAACVGELTDGEGPRLARCDRDLPLELTRVRATLDTCPVLAGFAVEPYHHRVPTLPDALDVLLELDALADAVTLGWAANQRLALPRRADLRQLKVAVSTHAQWLGVTGTLEVEEGLVLRFEQLLGARAGTRYVPIGHDRFVALSDELRRHLDALASLGTVAGKELRASPAVLPILDDLAADTHVTFDADVRAQLEALREVGRWTPRLPRGFAATLRDYQREGYTWLSRLARAELGACLADDMGLGKTVQALALLCQRARLGPAMVVCPTSVVLNWAAEAERFAPGLRVIVLADEDDRAGRLRALRPHELVICSYGLLASVSEALADVELATAVFDEAHALKNQDTKRAGAARELRAAHRLALTGTPVENHLGELWSLFQVILPGLLGSRSRFDETFATPISAGNRERSAQLRAILRPFLLRRTKAQVLDELPPRTDITIRVEPTPKERAFYEALRRRAVERMADADPKKARFELLAEITRLRQAAIDPRLVDETRGPAGAKLDVLMERLVQLRDEGHRALIFTQFLGSMALVREQLQARGFEHFEIEGSTPASERARRIEAFQAGEGDVFLLSLRAGGVGVNLTGADYVFHLDPWWNPKVEDQATDRAHRIGQRRPVTVYRLISEGTIEDKVMALHETKRQLADDVLEGHDRAALPDLDELRRLLEA